MPDQNENQDQNQNQDHPRLSDGRNDLGQNFERPISPEARSLGADFTRRNASDSPELGAEFADPRITDERALGESFADPNSLDDTRIGKSFVETNSSAKKPHRPVKEVVEAPFKKPGSKKPVFFIVAGVLALMVLGLIIGFIPRHNNDKKTGQLSRQESTDVPVVQAVRVVRGKEGAGLTVPGTTTPLVEALVYARATGYLTKRYADIGDHVHKGQLLGLIDAPDLDAQVAQARQQLDQAIAQEAQQETQLALTKVTVDRYRVLVAKGVFSRQDGDQQETNFQAQRANVASAARNVEAFRANLSRAIALQSFERVTSPFDGVVTQRNVDVGAYISTAGSGGSSAPTPQQTSGTTNGSSQTAGQTNTSGSSGSGMQLATPTTGGSSGGPLFAISQVQRLRIIVSVPEGYASQVAPHQKAELHFQEFPDQTFYGDVTRTSASLDENTRTLLTEIQVDNHAGHLLSGMYTVVTFNPQPQSSPGDTGNASTKAGPMVISGDAIAIRNDQPTVAVIDPSTNKVHLQPVVIGRDYGSEVEIVSGLRPNDLIASLFTDEVTEGAKVSPQEDKSAQKRTTATAPPPQNTPPGGSTQYSDPGITDQDMQGQNSKPGQKKPAGGKQAKGAGKGSNQ